jgi:hypothetical protein
MVTGTGKKAQGRPDVLHQPDHLLLFFGTNGFINNITGEKDNFRVKFINFSDQSFQPIRTVIHSQMNIGQHNRPQPGSAISRFINLEMKSLNHRVDSIKMA